MAMAPANRPLGGLTVGADGQMLTPQQVAEQRKVAAALMQQAGDTSPVGHWTAALNRGLQGYLGGRDMYRANETESNETARALDAFQNRPGMRQLSPVASALAGGQAPAIPAGADGIRQGLISRGLPEHIADAFILNFQDESGLNPGINEISPTVPGSRGGFGLYQLTGPRREAYEAFAADRGVDPADVDAQLDWLMYELQGPEAKAASSIMSAPDTGTAAAAIVNNFLRPAPEHRTARANRYMGGAGAGVSAAPAAGNVSEIAALLADPWLPESARAVLQAEMSQQMQMQNAAYEMQLQNQDPLRQLQIQQAQLEIQAAQNPAAAPRRTGYHDGRLIDVDTGEVIQEYPSAPDISAKEQEIARLLETNPSMSRADAIKIADGVYRLDTNPLTGDPQMVDTSTMSIVPITGLNQSPQGTILEPVSIEAPALPAGTQGAARDAFGAKGAGAGILNTVGGVVGWTPAPNIQQTQADFAVSAERALNDVASSYARQPPSWLLQNVSDLIPRPGEVLTSPDDAKAKFVAIHDNFSRDIESIENQLRTLALSPQGRQELEQNLMAATRGRDAMRQYVYQLANPGEDLSRFGIQSQQPAAPSTTSTGVTWSFVD